MRRLWLCGIALLLLAAPALARRRAVTPGSPGHCVLTTLVSASYAQLLDSDGQFIYFIDESATLARVPKLGGPRQDLADPLEEWLPLSMAVDATTVYIGALPFEAIGAPLPGAILSIPKNGGVVSVLISGVLTPFDLAVDDTHLYWVATGTFDFMKQTVKPDGKIERTRKDGTGRETLAGDLSGPVSLALDESIVYFGETGIAEGDASLGLERVAKTGGAVTVIDPGLGVLSLVLDGDTIVLFGGNDTTGGLLAIPKTGGPLRLLSPEESVAFGLQIADGRVYFLREGDESSSLAWVDLDTLATSVAREGIDGSDFLLDGCAAIVNTVDGDLIRTAR